MVNVLMSEDNNLNVLHLMSDLSEGKLKRVE
jgi:hypothetical protein